MELELEPLNFPSDQERPCVIAGPCSAETEEQVMTTAKQLAASWVLRTGKRIRDSLPVPPFETLFEITGKFQYFRPVSDPEQDGNPLGVFRQRMPLTEQFPKNHPH